MPWLVPAFAEPRSIVTLERLCTVTTAVASASTAVVIALANCETVSVPRAAGARVARDEARYPTGGCGGLDGGGGGGGALGGCGGGGGGRGGVLGGDGGDGDGGGQAQIGP